MFVIEKEGGRYSLYCKDCHCWIPNTANHEMRKEGVIAYTHNCKNGVCDFLNGEVSEADWERQKKQLNKEQYKWGDTEDKEIYEKGVIILWVDGSKNEVQNFVEDLTFRINQKVDWAYMGGRAHIDVLPNKVNEALKYVNDRKYMENFIKEYEMDNEYFDGRYFEILRIPMEKVLEEKGEEEE